MALKAARFVLFKNVVGKSDAEKHPVASSAGANEDKSVRDGQYYWHLEAKNGKLLACSGEGFKTRRAAHKNLTEVCQLATINENGVATAILFEVP